MDSSLHLLNTWLELSETFIWYSLKGLEKYKPLVLAGSFNNLSEFPLPGGEILMCHPAKSKWKGLKGRMAGDYQVENYSSCMQELGKREISIVHAHYGYRALVASELVSELNLPLVTNFYGYDVSHKAYLQRAEKGYNRLFKNGDRFLVEGPAMKKKLTHLGCPEDKIFQHNISIPLDKYTWRARTHGSNKPIKFLFIGRLVEKKGLHNALQAFNSIGDRINWEFTVVGDGPEKARAEKYIKDQELGARTNFTGYVNPGDLPGILNSHDILLQPSVTAGDGDCEGGAPTVILEAQACGLPVISTRHCDIPNILPEGDSGYLSEEKDISGLIENILKISGESEKWIAMGTAGRKFVEQNHDSVMLSRQLDNLYTETLKNH